MKPRELPDVGAPDPERTTSPILDDLGLDDEPPLYPGAEGEAVCLYNDVSYPEGSYVWAGDEVLRCERGGVWQRVEDPDIE